MWLRPKWLTEPNFIGHEIPNFLSQQDKTKALHNLTSDVARQMASYSHVAYDQSKTLKWIVNTTLYHQIEN